MTEPSRPDGSAAPEALPTHTEPRRGPLAIAAMVVAVVLSIAADLGTKEWAIRNLSSEVLTPRTTEICEVSAMGHKVDHRRQRPPIVIVPDFFELRYAENCGAAFGVMRNWSPLAKRLVFFPVAIGAVIVLGLMFVRGRGGRFLACAVPLIIAGAIGNFVDRLRFGYVVDFIRFYGETPEALRGLLGPYWEYPTFNVADVQIFVGVVFLLIDGWLEGRRERAAEEAAKREAARRDDASHGGGADTGAADDAAPLPPPSADHEPTS